jgi:hypothetical protein
MERVVDANEMTEVMKRMERELNEVIEKYALEVSMPLNYATIVVQKEMDVEGALFFCALSNIPDVGACRRLLRFGLVSLTETADSEIHYIASGTRQ